jgi:hypothetical protein
MGKLKALVIKAEEQDLDVENTDDLTVEELLEILEDDN